MLVLVGYADAHLERHASGVRPSAGVYPTLCWAASAFCFAADPSGWLLPVCLDSEDRHSTFLGAILRRHDGQFGFGHAADDDCCLAPGDSVHRVDRKEVVRFAPEIALGCGSSLSLGRSLQNLKHRRQ